MDNTMILIILVGVVILIQLAILLKPNKNNSDNKEIIHKVENLLRDNKDDINNNLNKFEREINKEQSDFKETFLKEINIFNLNNNQNSNNNLERLDKINKEFLLLQTNIMTTINNELEKVNKKVEERLNEGFKNTNETFNNILLRLSKIDETQKKIEGLSIEIGSLQDVLTDKKTRGNFGEVQLSIILSSAFGENNNNIYQLQKHLSNNTICDAFIKLPNEEFGIAIDSKFPLENYKRSIDNTLEESVRLAAERLFKSDMKKHINDISNKYIIEGETSNQAIMFLPAEAIFATVNAYHQDLIEYAHSKNVSITSPTTIMALFKVVLLVNRDNEMAKHSKELQEQLRDLGVEFSRYQDRWISLEKHIDQVTKDVKEINTTSNKISKKFNNISSGVIEDNLLD